MTISDQGATPDAIARRLAPGERLVWWDRPDPMRYARREANFGTLFGVFFFLFAIFWMSMAFRAPGPFFLFGVPFVLIGLWMVTAPLRAYRNAGTTAFALTDKRALIVTGPKVTARPLDHVDYVETESIADGSGNVLFLNEPVSFVPWQGNAQQMMRKSGFIAIADAERVGQEMLSLMEKRRSPAPASSQ
jgi:hypothetical protein